MSNLRIRPVSTGRFLQAKKSNFTYLIDQGVKIQSCVLMYLIEGADKRILVQAEELRYAIAPLMYQAGFYESQLVGLTRPWLDSLDRIPLVEGEKEIEKGIRSFRASFLQKRRPM